MKLYRYPVLLLQFLFLFMNYACGTDKMPDSNIVATYNNDQVVTVQELHKYVGDWLYHKKFPARADAYKNALNDMLVNQFKRLDFFEKGLDKDNNLIQDISRVINEELVEEYFKTQYLNKYANEEIAGKIYETMDREVSYQLIELSKPGDAVQEQLDSLQGKALAIKSEIENGKSFSSLVKEYSQNQISVSNNGYMPPVGWKQSILDPVGKIIFNMNKNDIRVLNSDYAFLIVKITDINKIQAAPFDSVKSEIISTLKGGYARISLEEFEKDKKYLIDENSLEWNEPALEQIFQWSNIPDFYRGEYQKIIKDALTNGENKTILTYNRGTLNYEELLRLLNNILVVGNANNIKIDDIKNFILEAIRTDMVVNKADSLDLKKNIFNALTANAAIRNQLVYLYNQMEVEAKIPEATDEALLRFFEDNESTLYYQLEKRNILVMVFPDKNDAENAMEKIKTGTIFEKVTGNYLVKTYIKEKDGEITSYLKDEKAVFGEDAFKLNESEVSGPVKFEDENNQVKYAIIKCYQIRPEKQLTFNDVKDTIAEDFKSYHRKNIEKEVEEKLKNKYHPVINEEVLAKLINPKK
ncbi:MAG: peptidyl-prolyl cis-trans isomerase [Ignavibacteriaceae bacterium]